MATIGNSNLTLADLAAQAEPNGGGMSDIVELLNATNDVTSIVPWVQCNDGSSNKSVVRTGIPTPTWRQLYMGIQPTKSTTAPVIDTCGMLEDLSEPDVDLIDKSADPVKARLNEAKAHIEGMGEQFASTLLYGDTGVNPERFMGLAPRFNTVSTATAQTAYNVIDGLGTGADNTSIWLIVFSDTTVCGLYPRGSVAGLKHTDEGMDWIVDPNNSAAKYKIYRDHYKWDAGLCVKDWRYVSRCCNIDVSDLGTLANTKLLVQYMIQMGERIPNLNAGNACYLVNRNIREKLRLGVLEKISSQLNWETVTGKRVMTFDDIPVYRTDAILATEGRIT